MQATELRITKTFPHVELRQVMDSVRPYDVLEILAEPVVDQSGATPASGLIRIVGAAKDPDLLAAAHELRKPVYYTDPQFGRLELDRALNWLSCEASWLGAPVALYASMDDAQSQDAALSIARALWQDAAAWDARIREFAADRLLELKNESWLEEGEGETTRAEFIQRMKLESITVSPEGDFDFMHHDDGLFSGHSIQVTGNLEEGPTDADIPG